MHNSIIKQVAHCDRNSGSQQNVMTAHSHRTLPNGITELGYEIFRDCIKLSKIYLPNALMKIGACAFENCCNLQSPWIPNGLTEIGERAFVGCKSIREIWIPESVIAIGEGAFDQCTGLIIKGKRGSLAEKYAKYNGFSFVPD